MDIRADVDPHYISGRNSDGRDRIISNNFVTARQPITIYRMPWYHSKITRQEAENLLSPKKDGLFLLRDSISYVGDYTLSVCSHNKVEHYQITYKGNKFSLDNEVFFLNLDELVQHYSLDADGLCSRLITPVTKTGGKSGAVSLLHFKMGGWIINEHDVELGDLIGKGNFGDVHKATYQGHTVAAKQLKDSEKGEQPFLQEAAVMTSLWHPNVVKLIGITERTLILIAEFMGRGNLLDYLQTRGRSAITKINQINYAKDTCAAMEYLNNIGLVHRDLAARNVLLHDDGTAKVSDFGLAQFGGLNLANRKIPVKWTAPEALKSNTFTSKSDMWSFGVVLWEIYSFGRVPYPRISHNDVLKQIEGGYRMEAPEGCPLEIYAIMKLAWEYHPQYRPTFTEVLSQLNFFCSITVSD